MKEILTGLSCACGFPENLLWSAKMAPKQSNATTTTIDSQSSICGTNENYFEFSFITWFELYCYTVDLLFVVCMYAFILWPI